MEFVVGRLVKLIYLVACAGRRTIYYVQVLVHLVVVRGTHLEQQTQAARRRDLVFALLYRIFFKLLFSILYL